MDLMGVAVVLCGPFLVFSEAGRDGRSNPMRCRSRSAPGRLQQKRRSPKAAGQRRTRKTAQKNIPSYVDALPLRAQLLRETEEAAQEKGVHVPLGGPMVRRDTVARNVSQSAQDVGAQETQREPGESKTMSGDAINNDGQPEQMTTLMISGLPCRVQIAELLEAMNKMGFGDMYDLVYMPSFKNPTNNPNNKTR